MAAVQVAVVMVSYKTASLAIDCLRSIRDERSANGLSIWAVVVDNASGDATAIEAAVRANRWGDWVDVLTAPRNGGFAYGNNLAFQHALSKGRVDYFQLLNPDTLVRPGAIAALVNCLQSNSTAGIAGSSYENLDGSDWPIAFRFPSVLSELESAAQFGLLSRLLKPWVVAVTMPRVLQRIDWVAGASMLVRGQLVQRLRGFDEGYFLYYEETDLCLRAHRLGFSTWYVPESKVMHIAGQSTGVTVRDASPQRLPAYWFESRRRFYLVNHGVLYAAAADIAAFLGHAIGRVKRALIRGGKPGVPHVVADLARHSILNPRADLPQQFHSGMEPRSPSPDSAAH